MVDMIDRNNLKQATLWSVVGILVTLIVGIPALYFTISKPLAHVSFKVLRESNVLDVHQPVQDLVISYRGEDIKKKNKNLRIMSIRIENDGDVDIRQGDYDQKQPWGIRLHDAEIVERPKVVDASSKYVRDNVDPVADINNLISFNKIILERGKYFVVEFQVLHDLAKQPQIETIGKIAGIESIPIIAANLEATQPSLWKNVFWGDAAVQIVRVIIYILGTIVLFIIIVLVIMIIEGRGRKSKTKRRKKLRDEYLKPLLDGKGSEEKKVIEYIFLNTRGESELLDDLLEMLCSKEILAKYSAMVRASDALTLPKGLKRSIFFHYSYGYPELIIEKDSTGDLRAKPGAIELIRELITHMTINPPNENL
jgi:hypothetical protein